MKLKLDENLGRTPAELLRQAGHEVSTVRDEGLQGAADRALIEACRREGRRLVTLDLGFASPLVFKPAEYVGIAVLRLPAGPTPDDLELEAKTLAGGLQRQSIEERLWVIQRGRIREYPPESEATDG